MPLSIPDALTAHEDTAVAKATTARTQLPRYLLSAMLAGAFVGVAVLLMLMVSAPLIADQNPSARLVQGAVFGVALTLVVFAGAELFTGNNMVMVQGLWSRKIKPIDLALVWAASLFGNLVGSLAFAGLVNASGVVTAGAPPGQQTVYQAALAGIVKSKASLSGGQLFFRAVLCNMLVCLALWMAARAASDAAKLVCLWWALLAFIASGFEHSIANMTSLGLAALIGVGSWSELGRNLVYTVPGNVVGGALLVGLAYAWIGKDAAPRPRAPRVEPDLLVFEPEVEPVLTKPKGNGRSPARAATATATRPTKRAPRTTTPPARRRTR